MQSDETSPSQELIEEIDGTLKRLSWLLWLLGRSIENWRPDIEQAAKALRAARERLMQQEERPSVAANLRAMVKENEKLLAKLAAAQEEIARLRSERCAVYDRVIPRSRKAREWKARAERAEQSLREKDAEIERWRSDFRTVNSALADTQERERMLREYVQHRSDCKAYLYPGIGECGCGLQAALSPSSPAQEDR